MQPIRLGLYSDEGGNTYTPAQDFLAANPGFLDNLPMPRARSKRGVSAPTVVRRAAMHRPAVQGYAIRYRDVFQYGDYGFAFERDCFDPRDFESSWVYANLDHRRDTAFARFSDRTLEVIGDDVGVAFRADVPRDMLENLRVVADRGRLQCSAGFTITKERLMCLDAGNLRLVEQAVLGHVALTPDPANARTQAAIVDAASSPSLRECMRAGLLSVDAAIGAVVRAISKGQS